MTSATLIPDNKRSGTTLRDGLQRLDQRLARLAATMSPPDTDANAFSSLYIGAQEVANLLHPQDVRLSACVAACADVPVCVPALTEGIGLFDTLATCYGLSALDRDALLIALAPELDLKYERVYAFLQDDITRRRPGLDLTLRLLCASEPPYSDELARFAPDAPLLRNAALRLVPVPSHPHAPLLAHSLLPDGQVVRFVLGQSGLDAPLTRFCQTFTPEEAHIKSGDWHHACLSAAPQAALVELFAQSSRSQSALCVYFETAMPEESRRIALKLAADAHAVLLTADLASASATLAQEADWETAMQRLLCESRLRQIPLYLEHWEALAEPAGARRRKSLQALLAQHPGIVLLSGIDAWTPDPDCPADVLVIALRPPDAAQRLACWNGQLAARSLRLSPADAQMLAETFLLTPAQIEVATRMAGQQARLQKDGRREPGTENLFADLVCAARACTGHALEGLAQTIEPTYSWRDLILPEEASGQLQSLCHRMQHRQRVMETWGFARKLAHGHGVCALFAGPPGTGKTMAAEVIARELHLNLYKIDLSGVVSKYIGETEKNLRAIFRAAERANAILFFDEADALFGKRSEVRDAHDRHANIETAYLLQQIEQYAGLCILASNLRQNLDEAFIRRLAYIVPFALPDEAHRRKLWDAIWPPELPLSPKIDWEILARTFPLSGGSIKNIALAAAFAVASEAGEVRMEHLLRETRREYEKMGKVPPEVRVKSGS